MSAIDPEHHVGRSRRARSADRYDCVTASPWARFAASAGAMIVAGGMVAAVNSVSPIAHGSWLAAYLVLVGGASQAALGLAPLALPVLPPSQRLVRFQLVLWNVGGLIVPAGVLVGSLAVVAGGSAALLGALGCFAAGAQPAGAGHSPRVLAYRLLVVVLGASVLVGCGLMA